MTAQRTMEARQGNPPAGSGTCLVSIDIAMGTSTEILAGASVKISPSPLAANDIAYVRKDGPEAGIDYLSGRRGPRGPVRTASWSPDGKRVAYWKLGPPKFPTKSFGRNPNYELSFNLPLPALSPSGKQLLVMLQPSFGLPLANKFTLNPALSFLAVTTPGTAPGTSPYEVLYQDKTRNLLPGGWSPTGDKVIFSLGMFPAFFDGFNSKFLKPADRVGDRATVAIINADGSGFQELTSGSANNAFPSFAPDGKRFVYRTFSADGMGLRIMPLPHSRSTTTSPLWSPRGDLIMFARLSGGTYQPGGSYDIYTIKPDGKSLKRLTKGQGNDAHMS